MNNSYRLHQRSRSSFGYYILFSVTHNIGSPTRRYFSPGIWRIHQIGIRTWRHYISLCCFHIFELGRHLAVRCHGDATSHNNNNRILCRNFAAYRLCTNSNGYSLLHRSVKLTLRMVSMPITEMRVPSLSV
jgi:hypothetical protein